MLAAAMALIASGILSGCGSFFSSSGSSHFAYVAGGVNDVSAYRIDDGSGSATSVFTAPFVAGNSPSSIVVHPSNQYLYVANAADNTISLFNMNLTSGALTEVLPRTPAGGLSPGFMTMDSGGNFLFVANQSSNDVWMFKIGTAGALTPVASIPVGASPAGLALSSSGFLYVPVPSFSLIAVLSVSSTSLQMLGSYPVTGGVAGVAVGPGAKFLYATNPALNTVSVFAIQGSGALAPVPGLTVGTGIAPAAAAVDLTGNALYVANAAAASVSQFQIDSTTGALTAYVNGPTVISGTNPAFVVVDPDGKFIFVGNTGSMSVTEYSINANGSLNNIATISVGFVPRSFAPVN
jgi:6-phosphogluconolactonase